MTHPPRNWRLGLFHALVATVTWGMLPLALKLLLPVMDPVTVTWYRFFASAIVLGPWLALHGQLPGVRGLGRLGAWLMVIAILGLIGNYVLYVVGLERVSPGTAQVVIQLAPMFLLLGGLAFFGERFRPLQWLGFAVLVVGLGLFFNDRLAELADTSGDTFFGVFVIVVSAVTWAAYALAQKRLYAKLPSQGILLVIYVAAVPLLLPFSTPLDVLRLDAVGLALLVFCGLNTLVAYGSFAAALYHWEATRVSAVLSITPLLTLIFVEVCAALFPAYATPEPLNALAVFGAVLVVAGSAACALAGTTEAKRSEPAVSAVESEAGR